MIELWNRSCWCLESYAVATALRRELTQTNENALAAGRTEDARHESVVEIDRLKHIGPNRLVSISGRRELATDQGIDADDQNDGRCRHRRQRLRGTLGP